MRPRRWRFQWAPSRAACTAVGGCSGKRYSRAGREVRVTVRPVVAGRSDDRAILRAAGCGGLPAGAHNTRSRRPLGMNTMLAAVLHDFNDLRLEQIPVPEPRNVGTVVVRIKSCGICATDYKAIKGIRRNVDVPVHPRPRAGGRRRGGRAGRDALPRRRRGHLPALGLLRLLPALPRGQHPLLRARLHHRRRRPGGRLAGRVRRVHADEGNVPAAQAAGRLLRRRRPDRAALRRLEGRDPVQRDAGRRRRGRHRRRRHRPAVPDGRPGRRRRPADRHRHQRLRARQALDLRRHARRRPAGRRRSATRSTRSSPTGPTWSSRRPGRSRRSS